MRFIHTADLHIGKSLGNVSLHDEQENILNQIVQIAVDKKVDGIFICGDVYDYSNPSADSVFLFDRFLTNLFTHKISVYLISGNHDSAYRLGFGNQIFGKQNIHISGGFKGSVPNIVLKDEYGTLVIHLLPFIKPEEVKIHFPDSEIKSFNDAVQMVISTIKIKKSTRNVLLAHQFVVSEESQPIRSESEIVSVGGTDMISSDIFSAFDYVALGHLHGAQKVGKETIRYSGSPLKYSFSECKQKKSLVLIDFKEKGNVEYELLPLIPKHDMREIRGPYLQLISDEVVNNPDASPDDYLRVILTDKFGSYDNPYHELQKKYPNLLNMVYESDLQSSPEQMYVPTGISMSNNPVDIFCDFFHHVHASRDWKMTPEMKNIVQDTFDEVMGEDYEN